MKWSCKIGEISGIGIYLHGTFLILLAWVGLVHYSRGNDLRDVVHGIVFLLALFGAIVLHELGHALAARRFGIGTRDITLFPIGGVARLERVPESPKQELLVALAGPAVNGAVAVVLLLSLLLLFGVKALGDAMEASFRDLSFVGNLSINLSALSERALMGIPFLVKMILINLALAVFNLLPAFPMDGGRVLRAILAMKIEYVLATQIVTALGQGMALVFGFLGLIYQFPFLAFIALFVWMGAAYEGSMVQMRSALAGIPVRRAMMTDFRSVSPSEQLGEIAQHVISGIQQDFPVVEYGRLVGMLTHGDLLRALAERGKEERVGSVMRSDFEKAEPSEMLAVVFARLGDHDCRSLPVVRGADLVGVVTTESVGEYLVAQSNKVGSQASSDDTMTYA